MATAFSGEFTITEHYAKALYNIEKVLKSLPYGDELIARGEDGMSAHFLEGWELEPIEQDDSRPRSAVQERALIIGGGDLRQSETSIAAVTIPLTPKRRNEETLQIRSLSGWPDASGMDTAASYDRKRQAIQLRARVKDIPALHTAAYEMMALINADILQHTPQFRADLSSLIRDRLAELEKHTTEFTQIMRELGITVVERTNGTKPVDVQVKQEVLILRNPEYINPSPIDQPFLTDTSTERIVQLVDQAGKGFEVTPKTFCKLAEEDLRDIILGYLNAVFIYPAATGETFSKQGKTDIHLRVPDGSVLIGECKYWNGPSNYSSTIDQLFRYITWRHTEALLVTFVRNRDMTRLIKAAMRTTKSHESFDNGYRQRQDTLYESGHRHPDDDEKHLRVHHLFFSLFVP